ncbi:DUF3024 domain-containing protein [Georgenia sp. SUBG003]|uniref:DUF3024 domain-containing protein n=1 Tax=Georgenia sp. SUBG003 TaxID=1497974 RepID=UPI003AB502BC
MALPETDLHRIRLWAREGVPKHLWDQVKVEADVVDRHVDIVEVRPPWDGVGGHMRFLVARLRYTKSTGLWAIYGRDRHLKFHEYKRKGPGGCRPRTDEEQPDPTVRKQPLHRSDGVCRGLPATTANPPESADIVSLQRLTRPESADPAQGCPKRGRARTG